MANNLDTTETLQGTVERVTFHSIENGFCVLRVKTPAHKDVVTVVGNVASISSGEYVQSSGVWFHDKNHGIQFKAQYIKVTTPTSLEGIEKYLGSGMIKGIGPKYAKKLVLAFGKHVFDVIENDPKRLNDVEGIGKARLEMITKAWKDQRIIRDIMLFLHGHGVSQTRAVRIYKTYGAHAIELISENPYQLAKDIRGIGFLSADKIAQNVGIEKNSLIRGRAGVRFALFETMEKGHCGFPKDELIKSCMALIDVERSLVEESLALELKEGEVINQEIDGTPYIFLSSLFYSEKLIAKNLLELKNNPLPWATIETDKAIEWGKKKTNLNLSRSQKEAVTLALKSKVLIITGGPGVGKTTLINSILTILKAKNLKVILTAPTGRAAKRLFESTKIPAKTIHRLLEVKPSSGGFGRNQDRPLDSDLLVVDEASMIDVPLMNALLKVVPKSSAIFFVGDIDQLPSVGPGKVLSDMIESEALPVVRLTEVFRQAKTSKIIESAHAINLGYFPNLENSKEELSDFYFMECETQEQCLDKMMTMITDRIPSRFGYDPKEDIQVLCPQTRGIVGTRNLNVELQKKINPQNDKSIIKFGSTYSVGDKVMQIENNYDKETYNGDIGIIKSISTEDTELTIRFDERDVVYDFSDLDEITLSYATTIHKSQGSEYPVVIIPLMMTHYIMLKRNLIYTGITRGKKIVILIGEKKALSIAIKNKDLEKRWSSLKIRLGEGA